MSTGDLLGQLPARLGGLLTSTAGLGFGGLPAAIRGLRRFQRREHLLLGLGGTRLGGDRPRLGAAPGRFGLRQLRGHHLRVQRRDLPACQRDQRTRLPDQRLQRAERVTRPAPMTPRPRHRPATARHCGNDASRHHRRTRESGRARTPEPGSRSQAACNDADRSPPGAVRPGPSADSGPRRHLRHGSFLSFPISAFPLPENERERKDREHGDRDAPGHAGFRQPASRQDSRYRRQQ